MYNINKKEEQSSYDIIVVAAKIIKNNIRELPCDKSNYPIINKIDNLKYALYLITVKYEIYKELGPASFLNFFKYLISSE